MCKKKDDDLKLIWYQGMIKHLQEHVKSECEYNLELMEENKRYKLKLENYEKTYKVVVDQRDRAFEEIAKLKNEKKSMTISFDIPLCGTPRLKYKDMNHE